MMIRLMIIAALGIALPATVNATTAMAAEGMNVLFIAADDLRCDLGCYGHPIAKTPNLDRLASRGIRFDRAYCAQAVCNPARSSLLTGRRPDTLALYNLTKHFRESIPDVVTLPQYFKNNGYFTQNIGKIFHNWRTESQGDPPSWSVPAVMHFDSHRNDIAMVKGKLPVDMATALRCECRDVPDEAYFDGRIANLAVDAIGTLSSSETPFFLAVGFWKPHLPFNAPKKYWDLYQRDQVAAPRFPDWPVGTPRIAWHNSQELFGKTDPSALTEQDAQELRHGYLAGISYMDAQVGRLLDALESNQLHERTLIVFWSDHGFQLGDHTLWCKTSNFELDARVPLIIAPPSGVAVSHTTAIVELLDLYPTITELCGLATADGMQGVSLVPLMDGTATSVKQAALTQHPRPAYYNSSMDAMGYSVRTDRFRYTQWRSKIDESIVGTELYDHQIDATESINRADDPSYHAQVEQLTAMLQSMIQDDTPKQ